MAQPSAGIDLAANHDSEIYGVTITFMLLAIIAVALRFFTVIRLRHQKPALDDYMMGLSLMVTMVECIYVCVQTRPYGVGRHVASLQPSQIQNFQKLIYTLSLLQPCTLALTKLAVLWLFYRIFTTRPFRIAIVIMSVIVGLWWFGNFFADALICIPVAYNWDQTIKGAHCGNHRLLYIVTPIPWIVTDLAILLLPLPMAWSLQMPRKQKIAISGVFLLGGFSLVATVTRYTYSFYNSNDITWTVAPLVVWNILEATISVIAACLIVMRPLFLQLYPDVLDRYARQKKPSTSNKTSATMIQPSAKYAYIDGSSATDTSISAHKGWLGSGKSKGMSDWNVDSEAMDFPFPGVHVQNTVSVARSEV